MNFDISSFSNQLTSSITIINHRLNIEQSATFSSNIAYTQKYLKNGKELLCNRAYKKIHRKSELSFYRLKDKQSKCIIQGCILKCGCHLPFCY